MSLKQKIYQKCLNEVNQRLMTCEKNMAMLQESLTSETKSSAGDKHETGRAMIQLEREQLGGQLKTIENEKAVLLKINPELKYEIAGLGSVIHTSGFTYFLSISSRKITVDNSDYYCISLQSPMGQILNGKRKGEIVKFRDSEMEILSIE